MPRNHEGQPQQHSSFKRAAAGIGLAGAAVVGAESGVLAHTPPAIHAEASTPQSLSQVNRGEPVRPAFGDPSVLRENVRIPLHVSMDMSSQTEPTIITYSKGSLVDSFAPNIPLDQPAPLDTKAAPHLNFLVSATKEILHDKGKASYVSIEDAKTGATFEGTFVKEKSSKIKLDGHTVKEDIYLMTQLEPGASSTGGGAVAWYPAVHTSHPDSYALSHFNSKTFRPFTKFKILSEVVTKNRHNHKKETIHVSLDTTGSQLPIQMQAITNVKDVSAKTFFQKFIQGKIASLKLKGEPGKLLPTATPTATAEITPGPTATPTIEASPTPYPTAIEPPTNFNTCAATEKLNIPNENLQQTLTDWTSGIIHIDNPRRFIEPGTLKVMPMGHEGNLPVDPSINTYSAIEGVLLGSKLLDNHLIVFLGFEDIACNQYFIPIDVGDMSNNFVITGLIELKDPYIEDRNNYVYHPYSHQVYQQQIQKLVQEKATIGTYNYLNAIPFTTLNIPQGQYYADQITPQASLAKQVDDYMFQTTYFHAIGDIPAPSIVNANPTSFSLSEIPFEEANVRYWVPPAG